MMGAAQQLMADPEMMMLMQDPEVRCIYQYHLVLLLDALR